MFTLDSHASIIDKFIQANYHQFLIDQQSHQKQSVIDGKMIKNKHQRYRKNKKSSKEELLQSIQMKNSGLKKYLGKLIQIINDNMVDLLINDQ